MAAEATMELLRMSRRPRTPGVDEAGVEDERGLELNLTAAGEVRCGGGLCVDANSLLSQAGVVGLDDALRVGTADVGGVRVGGVE